MDNTIINPNLRPEEGDNSNERRLEKLRINSRLYHEKMKDDPVYKQKMVDNAKRYYEREKGTVEFNRKNAERQMEYKKKMWGNEEYMAKRKEYSRRQCVKKKEATKVRKEERNAKKMQKVWEGSEQ